MNIALVLGFRLGTGGHFKSAAAMVGKLTQAGHRVSVLSAGGAHEMQLMFRAAGAKCTALPGLERWPRLPRPRVARQILRECGPETDVYHAYDPHGAPPAYLAAALARKAFVLTLAGGPVPPTPLPPCHTVVFSGELLEGLRERARAAGTTLHLIRARIDTELFRTEAVQPGFIERYALPVCGRKLVIAMRLKEGKRPWLDTLLSAAEQLAKSEMDVRIVVAGDGPLLDDVRSRAKEILSDATGEPVLYPIGPVFDARELVQLYSYADVVVGSGRGIMEAMACEKPVIILGERGEGELIDAESVEVAAHANFSGRHFREGRGASRSLVELIRTLISDEETLAHHGRFAHQYILSEQDARIGAGQLVHVYERALRNPARIADACTWSARLLGSAILVSAKWRLRRRRSQLGATE